MKTLLLTLLVLNGHFLILSQNLPEVFSAMNLTLKPNHVPPEMVNYVKALNRSMSKHGRGNGVWISYGDRGTQKQGLAWGFAFDFKASRDYYFPEPDAQGDNAYPQFNALSQKMTQDGVVLTQDVADSGPYTDYVCVGFSKLINPGMGGLVAVRALNIKKGSETEFEKFVTTEFYNTFNKTIPGLQAYIYKGDRGQNKDGYILLWVFDSVQRRNSYFATENGDASSEFTKAYESIATLNTKFNQFMDAQQSNEYTDWITIDVGH